MGCHYYFVFHPVAMVVKVATVAMEAMAALVLAAVGVRCCILH